MERSKSWWPMERSKAWWPMECSKLGGQWNVPSLVANGMKEKTPFHIFPLSLQQIYLNLQFFSFDLEVLFYHDDRLLLMPFLPFPRSINYDHAFQCNKSFTPSL
jgi:hypothetical protein